MTPNGGRSGRPNTLTRPHGLASPGTTPAAAVATATSTAGREPRGRPVPAALEPVAEGAGGLFRVELGVAGRPEFRSAVEPRA